MIRTLQLPYSQQWETFLQALGERSPSILLCSREARNPKRTRRFLSFAGGPRPRSQRGEGRLRGQRCRSDWIRGSPLWRTCEESRVRALKARPEAPSKSCPVIGQVVSHRCPFRRGPAAGPVSSEVGHSALPRFRRAARWRVPSSTGSFTRTGRLAAPVCYNMLNILAGNECFFQGDLTCPPGLPPTRQLLSGGSTICGSSRAATNYGTPLR